MNSRQRAYLGSLASNIDPIFQIGKDSLTPEIIEALDSAIEKRELIKVSVLKNCADDPKEIAAVIAERTHSQVVKVIGKKMIFYREAKKNPKIKLPATPITIDKTKLFSMPFQNLGKLLFRSSQADDIIKDGIRQIIIHIISSNKFTHRKLSSTDLAVWSVRVKSPL